MFDLRCRAIPRSFFHRLHKAFRTHIGPVRIDPFQASWRLPFGLATVQPSGISWTAGHNEYCLS
jgi:hypothetical protein